MRSMVKSVRINDEEQELLRKKAVELNKVLIQKGQQPLRDSEIVHILIDEGLELLEVGNSGQVKIIKQFRNIGLESTIRRRGLPELRIFLKKKENLMFPFFTAYQFLL